MKKLVLVVALAAGSVLLAAGQSSAAGQLCYEVNVDISGQAPIAQAACHELP